MTKSDSSTIMGQLESFLEEYLSKKAPAIPKNWKEFLVKIFPYLALIRVVFVLFGALTLLGILTFMVPFGTLGGMMVGRPFLGIGYLINVLFLIVIFILEVFAISPLFKKEKKGWCYLYYATLISGVNSLIHFDLAGLIIGAGLSLYLLFQIKEYYR